VEADGHQRVLEQRPLASVSVDIAGGHRRDPQPPGQALQSPVAGSVPVQERTLKLDPEMVAAERLQQAPQRRLVVDAAQSAAGQADQSG
jgi:hypothetical protein